MKGAGYLSKGMGPSAGRCVGGGFALDENRHFEYWRGARRGGSSRAANVGRFRLSHARFPALFYACENLCQPRL